MNYTAICPGTTCPVIQRMSSTGKITNLLPALSLPLSFQDWLPLAHFGVLTGFTAGALALRAAMLVAAMMLDRLIGDDAGTP